MFEITKVKKKWRKEVFESFVCIFVNTWTVFFEPSIFHDSIYFGACVQKITGILFPGAFCTCTIYHETIGRFEFRNVRASVAYLYSARETTIPACLCYTYRHLYLNFRAKENSDMRHFENTKSSLITDLASNPSRHCYFLFCFQFSPFLFHPLRLSNSNHFFTNIQNMKL